MLSCCLLHCLHHQCREWVEVSLHNHHQWVGWECLQCQLSACHQWAPTDLQFIEDTQVRSQSKFYMVKPYYSRVPYLCLEVYLVFLRWFWHLGKSEGQHQGSF
ncbi:hypothetical protein CFOL_v3_01811 [Cephalotus follicularis]|uniref:Uncharacterized protein n=1 Tax=Cephalotus follicularis TaxID=3775 RepID=A0A1Q3ARA3_CEPFO|nr:hypothetical protein CFOL_v3_01811 [Cephalotus follicularis]